MVKICPNCQKENVDSNNFCEYCGSDLLQFEEEKTDIKSVVDDSKETIKDNFDNVKEKLDDVIVKDKIARIEIKLKKQEEKIAKNQQVIDNQNENISNTKTVNNDEFHKLKYKLLYWYDKNTNQYNFSKTKSISILIFIFFTVWATISPSAPGLIVAIMIGLMFAVPAFLISYVIHYVMNRK